MQIFPPEKKFRIMFQNMNGIYNTKNKWCKIELAAKIMAEHDVAITGSLAARDDGRVYNRLLFVTPDGACQHYDKRHLFRMSGEHEHYAAGRDKLVVEWRDWRICPMVCYIFFRCCCCGWLKNK